MPPNLRYVLIVTGSAALSWAVMVAPVLTGSFAWIVAGQFFGPIVFGAIVYAADRKGMF